MTKEEIVQELDKYVKNINTCFSVDGKDGDLTLNMNGIYIAYFLNFEFNKYIIDTTENNYYDIIDVINFDIIKKFYDKAVELLKKSRVLYTVQAIKNDTFSFLNYCYENSKYIFANKCDGGLYKTSFTQSEIEALKQRDDIAIDWDKAIIKEAN